MAQHKAATSVTIAPTAESSGFAQIVERYWKAAAVLAVLVTVGVILWQYQHHTRREADDQSWEKLTAVAPEDPATGTLKGPAKDLEDLAGQVKGTQAGPWALLIGAQSAIEARDWQRVDTLLGQLRSDYPDHQVVREPLAFETSDRKETLVDQLGRRAKLLREWAAAHPNLYQNAELPADAPRVRFNTDRGPIVVGLYTAAAPKHCENFLKLVGEGFYGGTKFHSVIGGMYVQGGDPNTKPGAVGDWGQGGPGYTLEPEENDLHHFMGYLASAPDPKGGAISGSQFYLTTEDALTLGTNSVVFGKVVEGLDILRQMSLASVVPNSTRPEDPVTLQSAELL
ncbi:MAG: peptidylprolyl isomerase [Planctomycetota bacterium]